MNYFAHARVAATVGGDAAFVLGSMLPDFAHMLGERQFALDHDALRAGVRHHHRTDVAFHRIPAFVTLVRDSTRWLRANGVSRGPARGAAHVGVELLLDGALVGDLQGDAAYLRALEVAPGLESAIRWHHDDTSLRWQYLCARLSRQGLPYALRDPLRVSERLARVLDGRPRLRLTQAEQEIVARWLGAAKPDLARAASAILAATLTAIA